MNSLGGPVGARASGILLLASMLLSGWSYALTTASEDYEAGVEAVRAGKVAEGVEVLRRALQKMPGNAKIHQCLGVALLRKLPSPSPNELITILEGLEEKQHTAESYYWLKEAYLEKGNHGVARQYAQKALRLEPAHIRVSDIGRGLRAGEDVREHSRQHDFAQSVATLGTVLATAVFFAWAVKRFVLQDLGVGSMLLWFLFVLCVLAFGAFVMELLSPADLLDMWELILGTLESLFYEGTMSAP